MRAYVTFVCSVSARLAHPGDEVESKGKHACTRYIRLQGLFWKVKVSAAEQWQATVPGGACMNRRMMVLTSAVVALVAALVLGDVGREPPAVLPPEVGGQEVAVVWGWLEIERTAIPSGWTSRRKSARAMKPIEDGGVLDGVQVETDADVHREGVGVHVGADSDDTVDRGRRVGGTVGLEHALGDVCVWSWRPDGDWCPVLHRPVMRGQKPRPMLEGPRQDLGPFHGQRALQYPVEHDKV